MVHSTLPRFFSGQSLPHSVSNAHISIPLGIIIGLLASFVQSLGLTIQRKSHVLNQLLPPHKQSVEHRRPLWLLGFAIFISSNIIGSLVQIASLPVVILAPLGAVSLLWNAFFAKILLGDVFSPWMILGTLLIAGGAVLIAIFGIVPEPTRSLEDLLELFSRPAFVAYFSLLGAAVVVCLIITHVIDYSLGRRTAQLVSPVSCSPTSISGGLPANPSTLTTGVTNAITETITTERTPLLQLDGKKSPSSSATSLSSNRRRHGSALRRLNHTRLMIAISYASFSGIISGMCLLFAKSGVELLLLTLRGHNQFWRWQAWMLVLGLVAFALLQLWYLHKALTLADPTLVCPSAFCFYNLSSIVNGLVYFDQFSLISPLHLCLVVLGIVILLGGVWVVSIQSGGGGVDIGAWDDESECSSDRGEEPHTSSDLETSDEERSTRIRAVAMGRQTRSESNVPAASTSPDLTGLGLDIGSSRPPRVQSTISREESSGERRVRVSPLRTRTSRRRTIPPAGAEILVAPGHLHRSTSYTPSSPPPLPINPVSTLGAGFQIGLSPVSPGFAIVPRERRRRVSGLGFSDTVLEAQAKARRRTLSEGDRPDISGGEETGVLPESRGAEGQTPGGKGKGRDTGRSRASWAWLREVFHR